MPNALYNSAFPERKPAWLTLATTAPAAGASLTVADMVQTFVMIPLATIATATVRFPQAPMDQQPLRICTTQDVTLLTLTPGTGHTISGAPAPVLFPANTSMAWVFSKETLTWYRIG